MSDSQTFGFAKLVPGFDFLQNLAKGTAGGLPPSTPLSNWIAPTLSVEELDKRIQELRAVQFWLEQNGKALAATIQALEVQKMTLATLQGMNLGMQELAESLQFKPGAMPTAAAPAPATETAKPASGAASSRTRSRSASAPAPSPAASMGQAVDPLQWWSALSQQFQQIAQSALQEVAASTAASPSARSTAPSARTASSGKAAKKAAPAKRGTGAPVARTPRAPRTPRP